MNWHTLITTMDTYVATHAPELLIVIPAIFILVYMFAWEMGFWRGQKTRKRDIDASLDILESPTINPLVKIKYVKLLLSKKEEDDRRTIGRKGNKFLYSLQI